MIKKNNKKLFLTVAEISNGNYKEEDWNPIFNGYVNYCCPHVYKCKQPNCVNMSWAYCPYNCFRKCSYACSEADECMLGYSEECPAAEEE